MTLIVENGTGIADANTYVNSDFVDAYYTTRLGGVQSQAWLAATNAKDKDGAIIRATDYIEENYDWIGCKEYDVNDLGFPRTTDPSVIPSNLKKAVAELASRALSAELDPDISRDDRVIFDKTDVLSSRWSENDSLETMYNRVDKLLKGLYIQGGEIYRA